MKYTDLHIQTQRDFPSNMRTQGFGWLVRAGYMTRENEILPLGQHAIEKLKTLSKNKSFINELALPVISNENETFFPISTGSIEVIHCPACKYTERKELALFKKTPFSQEEKLPLEKVSTPDCNTIESLVKFLNIAKEKTAKALMYTRISDNQFIFVVIRGDMTLSESKLKTAVGEVRLATQEEIINAGAVPGYASPVGLKNTLIVVDDFIPQSTNLVAGANDAGYHLVNTNYERDYSASIVTDLTLANQNDACVKCANLLEELNASSLATRYQFDFENILFAIAETYQDDKGLTLSKYVAPFDVYIMNIPGKEMDTRAKAEELYVILQNAGISVLFDDRDERAGVKFNDADLIGCPIRITVGEKNLKEGMVELKPRTADKNILILYNEVVSKIQETLNQ